MKKYIALATGVLVALTVHTVAGAASISVQSENANISYTYSAEEAAVFDIDKIIVNPENAEETITDTWVITNKTDAQGEVELSLRISVEPVSDNWLYSPLDYYSFRIMDEAGNVVYDSADAELSEVGDGVKDIVIGSFNADAVNETKTFTVEYSISEKGAANLSQEDVSDLTFSLTANEPVKAEVEIQKETPTAKPKFELETTNKPTGEPEPTEQPQPSEAVSEQATAAPVKEKKLVCGTDIDSGRYVVKGNGVVKVESKAGEAESQVILNDGSVEGVDGEESAVITVSDGDIITLLPLDGQEKASVALEKTNSGSGNAGASRPTATPAASTKTNPKTGESDVASLCVVMLLAVVGISVLEIIKRKRVK